MSCTNKNTSFKNRTRPQQKSTLQTRENNENLAFTENAENIKDLHSNCLQETTNSMTKNLNNK